jgi:hypothetical protein
MTIYVFYAKITVKYGVLCKTKCNPWFFAKKSRRYGVICYLLEAVEGQEVVWEDEPERLLLEKGCLLCCQLTLQLPLYLPLDDRSGTSLLHL